MSDSVECPLCSETFSKSKVEAHASSCGMPQKTSTSSPFAARRATPPSKFFQTNETKKRCLNTVQDANPILPNKKVKTEEDSSLMEEVVAKSKEKVGRSGRVPLADTLRPKDFSTYIGQDEAVGLGTQIRSVLDSECLPSIILWGPPGCGKTSLANVIANKVKGKSRFVKMSACTCGVSEV